VTVTEALGFKVFWRDSIERFFDFDPRTLDFEAKERVIAPGFVGTVKIIGVATKILTL